MKPSQAKQSLLIVTLATVALGSGTVWAGTNVWTSIGPPGGGTYALTIDPQNPSTAYAGTDGGVFKTTDRGASWSAANSGLASPVYTLAIDPQNPGTIYAAVRFKGLFKTTDGGASWSDLALSGGYAPYSVVVNPQDPSVLYAGTNAGVLKSKDAGASWNALNSAFGPLSATLIMDPHNPSVLYAVNGSLLFKSTDAAESWRQLNSSGLLRHVQSLAIDLQNSSTLYAGTTTDLDGIGGVFKSTDGGLTG